MTRPAYPEDAPVPVARPRRRALAPPVPERDPRFDHVSLAQLRTYRASLTAEEDRASYWRRILQARLDMVRVSAALAGGPVDAEHLAPVLATVRAHPSALAPVHIIGAEHGPSLLELTALWNEDPVPGGPAANLDLLTRLEAMEAALSAYRTSLHQQLAEATGELIARYREQPSLCLSALPLPGGSAG